ncbi:fimbrial protein [Ewingella americana]|uniref:fimbrial protein n=1 Tax=Ewingella americana TaxID=41202 RepID=UPI00163A089E|nr:fimbrial protein [Ewingella americana]QMV52096.1 type 1 fimbrial protein [Ewingella americana]
MKMTSLFKMSMLAAGMFAALGANAADGTINVNGSIVAAGCVVEGAETVTEVNFGTLSPQNFTAVGTISDKKDVSFVLKDCPASLTSAKLVFMGRTDTTNTQLVQLYDTSKAKGIGIALYKKDGGMIPMNTTSEPFPIDAETGTAAIALQAAVMSTSEVVSGGDFTAVAFFTMSYN